MEKKTRKAINEVTGEEFDTNIPIQKTLSEKRKELFEEVFNKKIEAELFTIFNCIRNQDKEAVEKLKEELFMDSAEYNKFINKKIDKIFGEFK